MKKREQIEIEDQNPLRWPDGWPRTLIGDRQSRTAWKKTDREYRSAIADELQKLGATAARITTNAGEKARQDPGVAVWFSMNQREDFSWQKGLQIDNPAPTIDEIDRAFRRLIADHHPDRINAGSGGDIEIFKKLREHRDKAKAWVLGTSQINYESCIASDKYNDIRLNLAALRLALSYFRGLERVGVPAILDRVMNQAFKAALLTDQKQEAQHATAAST